MKIIFATVCFLLMLSLAHAEGDVIAGEKKATVCAACHGKDGNLVSPEWPKLAGQHAKYLLKQIQAFKKGQSGGRFNATMTPLVANLSQQDMEDIAAYYASQKTTIGKADPKLLKRGQQLYRGGDFSKQIPACSACHGPAGLGNGEAGFPKLSGQNAGYIVEELLDYQEGKRTSDINQIMRDITHQMSKDDMVAVASYIQGLH